MTSLAERSAGLRQKAQSTVIARYTVVVLGDIYQPRKIRRVQLSSALSFAIVRGGAWVRSPQKQRMAIDGGDGEARQPVRLGIGRGQPHQVTVLTFCFGQRKCGRIRRGAAQQGAKDTVQRTVDCGPGGSCKVMV